MADDTLATERLILRPPVPKTLRGWLDTLRQHHDALRLAVTPTGQRYLAELALPPLPPGTALYCQGLVVDPFGVLRSTGSVRALWP